MADTSRPDVSDSQPESSGNSNDDFEKLDAPGSGFENDGGEADGSHAAADAGAYDHDYERNQEAEISTTTDLGGEEEAEEDRYAGASEADVYTHSSEPLISLGEADPSSFQVQPSAPPVSEFSQPEPLIDSDNSTSFEHDSHDPNDILASFASSTMPSSNSPQPIPSSNNPPPQFEGLVETQKEKSKEVTEQTTEETDKEKIVSSDIRSSQSTDSMKLHVGSRISQTESLLEQTDFYKALVSFGGWLKGVDPRGSAGPCVFMDLIYWRDVRTTGVVFGSMMVVLLSLAIFSLLSVVAYLSLACLAVTFTFVVYKKVMAAVQKSGDGHPFKPLLDMDIALKEDKLKNVIQHVLNNVNATTSEVRRLFLIEDFVDSIKFGLLLWVFTYIGSWFNGMTLIILAVVLLFTLPKVYETYQVQIDNYIGLAKAQVDNVLKIVQSKLPFLKKKEKAQ